MTTNSEDKNNENDYDISELFSLPSYDELVSAFCNVLDGVQDHDIQSMTGLPDKDVEDIIEIRRAVMDLWKPNDPIKKL